MDNCPRCGEALGPAAGRYCINCGQRIDGTVAPAAYDDWRTDTSERSAVAASTVARPPAAPPAAPPPVDPERPHRADGPAHGVPIALLAGLVGLVLLALLGAWLFFGGSGDDPTPVAQETKKADPTPIPSSPVTPEPSTSPKPPKPSKSPPGKPVDLTREVDASAPRTAPPSTDSSGNRVTYEASQMLDGVPETCWRMAGDGTGTELVLTLPKQAEITELGLINGYAKTARDARGPLDWYHGNRRILRVVWGFDDGTEVSQALADTTSMQTIEVDHVPTTTVTLTLEQVSPPGTGRAARNYTAISDVSLLGVVG